MIRGLYTAAAGALVAQSNADTIANNLANVSTGGFKRTLLQVESTPTMDLYRIQTDPAPSGGKAARQRVGPLGFGSLVRDTPAVFEQGALQTTGNPLDVGLNGPGFFAIQTRQGLRYTRDGAFVRNAQGLLVTQNGDLVLGQRGAVALPPGDVQIDRNGGITVGGQQVDRLRISEFGQLANLRKEGDNRFVDTGARAMAARGTAVAQGALEKSNADVVRSMVDLIVAERWFDANEKVIQTQDDATDRAITVVGRSTPQ